MRVKKIKSLRYCRDCLNEEFGLNLKREDVIVNTYSVYECKRCGQYRHIVEDIPFKKRWKILF